MNPQATANFFDHQHPDFRFREELAPARNETVVIKTAFGAFNSSNLDDVARTLGVSEFVIAGISWKQATQSANSSWCALTLRTAARTWVLAAAHAATCSVLLSRCLMARRSDQQPSYGAHGEVPSSAYAVANTWFCSATDAFPKSAGLPPAATQAE
jgi:nicotinamidase-related amidase